MPDLLQLDRSPFFVIAGPCVIESSDQCITIGAHVKAVCPMSAIRRARAVLLNAFTCGRSRVPGRTVAILARFAVLKERDGEGRFVP